jgi:hypothetical protein
MRSIHQRLSELDAMDIEALEEKHGLTAQDYMAAFE